MDLIISFLNKTFAFDENSPLLFTQFYFWAFFAIVFAIFSLFHSKRLLRNTFLFIVSLFFYYKTSGLFVLLLMFATLSDFFIAKFVHRTTDELKRKIWVGVSISINLLVLSYFKYSYFFVDLINSLFHTSFEVYDYFAAIGNAIMGAERFRVDQIVLPVGISFYTFQTISYTMDVYRRRVEPVKNILDYGFYVSFFPQLVAGPIVRAAEFIPQLYKPYFLARRQFGIAVFWIINGLAKKIILSDYLAVNFIDRVFDNPMLFTGFENLMALLIYSLQVYADFSGYTDIAIGVAMIMGFYLPQNFNSPYKAPNASNFWKRWHISLSRWLQDYFYIPLGGNRRASFGTFFWVITLTLIALILSRSVTTAIIVLSIALAIVLWGLFNPIRRMKIITYLNMMMNGRLDGHIVQGHVDITAECVSVRDADGSWYFTFRYPKDTAMAAKGYMTVDKGSVTVNGVSLTVCEPTDDSFSVAIIPYTFEHTNFHTIEVGTKVNIEFDIIGKYIARIASLQ